MAVETEPAGCTRDFATADAAEGGTAACFGESASTGVETPAINAKMVNPWKTIALDKCLFVMKMP